MQSKIKWGYKIRLGVQIGIFVLVEFLALTKWLKESDVVIAWLPEISLHAVCPFGGVVTAYSFFSTGDFLPKLHSAAFILMALGMVVALFFGPLFCGYACPLGSFQEWLGKLGRKLFPKRYGKLIPPKLDKALGYLRYGVLAMCFFKRRLLASWCLQRLIPSMRCSTL